MGVNQVTPRRCATPGCAEVRDLEPWGVDRLLVCAACKAELTVALDAVLKETGERDAMNASRRIE